MMLSGRILPYLLVTVILATACEGQTPPPDANEAAEAPPPVEVERSLDDLLASADVDQGKRLFLQCRACHSLEEGGINKVGPNLYGFFGKQAGQVPEFAYSDALSESQIIWTPATLNQWLERPSEYLPGNRMVFVGIRKPQDRASLIAYLQQETGVSEN